MSRTRKTEAETQEKVPQSVFGTPESDLPGTGFEELEDESPASDVPVEDDIFEDYAAGLIKKGDRVTFTIFRDGEVVGGSVKWPWSWAKTQDKWGGGTYKVLVRSSQVGRYVKGQVRTLAAIDAPEEDDDAREETQRSDRSSTTDLLLLLENMRKADKEEARLREERQEQDRREEKRRQEEESRERAREAKDNQNTTMMMFMKMMEAQNAQTTALMTALVGGKKEEVKVEKIVEMMDARMEKMLDRLTGKGKEKEFDTMKLLELQDKFEEKGYKRAMDAHKLAEAKAEELAEIRANGGAPAEPEEKGSTTMKLIESVVPALQSMMAMRGGLPGLPAPAAPVAPSVPTAPALAGVNPNQPALPPPVVGGPKAPLGPSSAGGAFGHSEIATGRQVARPPMVGPRAAPIAFNKPKTAERAQPVMNQRKFVEDVVISEIGKDLQANFLTQKFQPEATADKCLSILDKINMSAKQLSSEFTLSDMITVAKAKGIPDAIVPYLERFHARVVARATTEALEADRAKEQKSANPQDATPVGAGSPAPSSEPDHR